MRRFVLLGALASGGVAWAQDGPAALQTELARLQGMAEGLQRDLPNIACKQVAVSERLRGEKVKKHVVIEAELTVVRDAKGELQEQSKFTYLDGKPVTTERVALPIFVKGGLTQSFNFFLSSYRECFVFRGDARRIDFVSVDAVVEEKCDVARGSVGFVLMDGAGTVTRIERRSPVEAASRMHTAAFSAADLQLVALGAKTFPLATVAVSEIPDGKDMRRFTSRYYDCRLYQGSLKILPGVTVVPDEEPESAPHP